MSWIEDVKENLREIGGAILTNDLRQLELADAPPTIFLALVTRGYCEFPGILHRHQEKLEVLRRNPNAVALVLEEKGAEKIPAFMLNGFKAVMRYEVDPKKKIPWNILKVWALLAQLKYIEIAFPEV